MPQLSIRFFHVFCDIYFKRNTLEVYTYINHLTPNLDIENTELKF